MEEETKKLSNKERSVAYPYLTLSDAIDNTRLLRDSLGKGPYSRLEAGKALGHTTLTGPAARKVAALVQYGLLEREGNTYVQSTLAQNILRPLSDEQRDTEVRKAALKPGLFAKLSEKFAGQALPNLLENIVIREGISESAAKEVVRVFRESMSSAGILVNGVMTTSIYNHDESTNDDKQEDVLVNSPVPLGSSQSRNMLVGNDDFIFEFSGGIRLLIPRTQESSEAIADGGLKVVRDELKNFSSKVIPVETAEIDSRV